MSTVLIHRPPRQMGPEVSEGEITLQEPPLIPEPPSGFMLMLQYVPIALAPLGLVIIFLRPVGGGGGALTFVGLGLMLLAVIVVLLSAVLRAVGERKRQLGTERRDYLRYLARVRKQVRAAVTAHRQAQAWRQPDPGALASLVHTSRLWERRRSAEDFGDTRVAVGEQQLGLRLKPVTNNPVEDLEPLCAHSLRRFIKAYRTVLDQPVVIALPRYSRVLMHGDPAVVVALARAMLAGLAVMHSPDDLRIVVVVSQNRRDSWHWVKWLPHVLHPAEWDALGQVRLATDRVTNLERLLGDELAGRPAFDPSRPASADEPYTVILLDGVDVPAGSRIATEGYRGVTVIDVAGALPWQTAPDTLWLRMSTNVVEMVTAAADRSEVVRPLGRPDQLGPVAARALAALLAPLRMSAGSDVDGQLDANVELTTMLGIADLTQHEPRQLWQRWPPTSRLRIPLGVSSTGGSVELDLKESAQGGMGPHGMLVGATGSGKSELLRTLVLALALTHSSDALNFVLIDFKGGATFLGLDELPHTSAVITNLADEEALVARMQDALHGELIRRQEVLRRAGTVSLAEYNTRRSRGDTPLDPLPSLLIIVDEFSELLATHREFSDLFVMIGRLGRSLGVHLLLASQRLDEGRVHQLESHLSYRIALRTFSAMESRGVLGVPDAYELPPLPGNGFLKPDVASLIRFKAAYVSGAYRPRRIADVASSGETRVREYQLDRVEAPASPEASTDTGDTSQTQPRTLLEVALDRLRGSGPPAHQVWLPPLGASQDLDALLPPLVMDPQRGLTTENRALHGALWAPVGVVDRPFDQARDLLAADLSGSGGHAGIAGGPQSGKSTLVRTLMVSLALTHTPTEVQFFCLDFGGGLLGAMAELPHVAGVTGRHDVERISRTVAEVVEIMTRRERLFSQHGIDSMAAFRRRRAAGELADEPHGDVFLVIDGWGTIRTDFMDMATTVTAIATRGLSYGVHLVIAASRWGEVTTGLRDLLGTRLELRLGDPVDSVINMRVAGTVPKLPGRGITDQNLHFLAALPRISGTAGASAADATAGVAETLELINMAWSGARAPAVRMLPAVLAVSDLPEPEGRLRVPIGCEGEKLGVQWHDFEETPHLIIAGDSESGKTNLLKVIVRAVLQRYSPAEARVMAVDIRRGLYSFIPSEYQLGYGISAATTRTMVESAAAAMQQRLPDASITPDRLRLRDWWTGPELFLVVDDYDMVAGGIGAPHPLAPLLPFLAQGTELGLHVIVARSSNGLGRALGDPMLRGLLDANTPALLFSCQPSEGLLFNGIRPKALPVGRAMHITRRRTLEIQTALLPDDEILG